MPIQTDISQGTGSVAAVVLKGSQVNMGQMFDIKLLKGTTKTIQTFFEILTYPCSEGCSELSRIKLVGIVFSSTILLYIIYDMLSYFLARA